MATPLISACSRNSEAHSVHWKRPGEFHAGLKGFTSMSNGTEGLMTGCNMIWDCMIANYDICWAHADAVHLSCVPIVLVFPVDTKLIRFCYSHSKLLTCSCVATVANYVMDVNLSMHFVPSSLLPIPFTPAPSDLPSPPHSQSPSAANRIKDESESGSVLP